MEVKDLFLKMALHAWDTQIGRISAILESMPAEKLQQKIAPGRNSGFYVVGHLLAIHDAMNTILGLGKRSHADLDQAFVTNPESSGLVSPPFESIKDDWFEVHENLRRQFEEMNPDEWLKRHELMTDADFEKEPWRNKLSVLINRTNHAAYHLGQLKLLPE